MKTVLSKKKYILIFSIIIVVSVVLDQLTKIFLEDILADSVTINVLGDWLVFRWTINQGSAFGQLNGQSILFFIVTILGLPLFVYMLLRARNRSIWGQLGFAFMIGGTIGNAIDRAFLGDGFFNGGVRDFIYVNNFAIFNVADSFLVVGVILACLAIIIFDSDSLIHDIARERIARQCDKSADSVATDKDNQQHHD